MHRADKSLPFFVTFILLLMHKALVARCIDACLLNADISAGLSWIPRCTDHQAWFRKNQRTLLRLLSDGKTFQGALDVCLVTLESAGAPCVALLSMCLHDLLTLLNGQTPFSRIPAVTLVWPGLEEAPPVWKDSL